MVDEMSSTREVDIKYLGAEEQSDGSYLCTYGNIKWYNEEGDYHREEGPSKIFGKVGRVEWYLNGIEYQTFDHWLKLSPISDEDKMMLRLQYG